MNTPTETPTPRVDEALIYGGQPANPWVPIAFARQLERELSAVSEANARLNLELVDEQARLAAVTKERDEAVAVANEFGDALEKLARGTGIEAKSDDLVIQVLNKLAEANADRARLREALGEALPQFKHLATLVTDHVRQGDMWLEEVSPDEWALSLERALSTPPPPVVPREEMESLVGFCEDFRDVVLNGRGSLESVLGGDQTNAVLQEYDFAVGLRVEAYRAKHPTSNLTSQQEVAG
jgi:hypothetical protein